MRSAVAFVVLWLAVCPGAARAQETTGDVVGTIRSQDGAVLPGVTVTIENFDRGFERSTISGARGSFFLPALRPARYELTFSLSGFQTVKRPVPVELGGTATMDIQMQVGEFTDTIEVTGVTPLVDVKSTVSGLTVSTDELNARLPVARDVTRVAMLAPGTIDADPRFGGVSDWWDSSNPAPPQAAFPGAKKGLPGLLRRRDGGIGGGSLRRGHRAVRLHLR